MIAGLAGVAPDSPASVSTVARVRGDRISLLVGITGHHDVEVADEPALRVSVAALLAEIASSAPHTPIVVLSALAPGAGLLGAEVARQAGLDVIACLPAPRDVYEREFAAADVARFRAALDAAAGVLVVAPDASAAGGRSATGWYLAFHSHILVTLWDGGPPHTAGGTGDVVRLRETGLSSTRWAVDPAAPRDPDPMPVFAVMTRRHGAPERADLGTVERRYPRRFSGDGKARETFDAAIERLDRFNHDLADSAPQPAVPGGLRGLMAQVDATANRLQRRALYQLRTLYGLSVLAVAAQLGFAGTFAPEAIKVATLAAAFAAYRVARSANLEDRYQDYRALSEGLRVQIAWNALGDGLRYVDPCYMRMQQSELQWIRLALRSAALVASVTPAAPDDRAAFDWVREQWRYYHRAALRDQRSAKFYGKIGKFSQVFGLVTMVLAAALLLPVFAGVPPGITAGTKHWATALTALVGAAAALFGSYSDKRGYSSNAKRYDRMFGVFDRALRQLHRAARGTPGERAEIYHDVGREALVEQAEWLLARRERPLRVVGR